MSLRARLLLSYILIVGVGFFTFAERANKELRPRAFRALEEVMVDISVLLAEIVAHRSGDGSLNVDGWAEVFHGVAQRRFSAHIYEVEKTAVDMRILVTDQDGMVIFDSEGRSVGQDYSLWNDIRRTLDGGYGARSTRVVREDQTTSVLHVAAPILRDGRMLGVVSLAKPTTLAHEFIENARSELSRTALILTLLVMAAGVMAGWMFTRPIARLTAYARAVRDGKRVSPPKLGRDELGTMAEALEEMRVALEGKNYVEEYVQSLTHELKSPVSAIRGAAELLKEASMPEEQRAIFLQNIHSEAERANRIIERLLELASVEARQGLEKVESVDLTTAVESVVTSYKPSCLAKGVEIRFSGSRAPLRIQAETFLLTQAVSNLIQNALEFSPRGGGIDVSTSSAENAALVCVRDEGPGVPAYAQERIFDRFYSLPRPDSRRKSSGLGLPFVREVMQLHGGTVRVANRSDREGTEAVLEFPLHVPS